MSKRSTNFTGKKPMKASHVLSLMQWVGMSDDEIRAAVTEQQEVTRKIARTYGEASAEHDPNWKADNDLPF